MMKEIEFANPGYLYILIINLPLIAWYIWKQKEQFATMQISSVSWADKAPISYKIYLRHIIFALRLIVISCIIIALARPQSTDEWANENKEGIDIMISVDISMSMLARDFKPDRLEAAKAVASEFIAGRPNDRMGLVVYAGESYTQCPLTTDHKVLLNLFSEVKTDVFEGLDNSERYSGTAIGLGLANAVKRLKDSEAISKVIILLTDGENNTGAIDPLTAADLAKTFGIRVYTIGVGTKGEAPFPAYYHPITGRIVYQNQPVNIDEETLQKIADITDGEYFRATNNQALREIYTEIDKLEKSKISVQEFNKKEEEFMPWIWVALILLIADLILRKTLFRSIP